MSYQLLATFEKQQYWPILIFVDIDGGSEYCAYDSFHPVCSRNEVITMTSAIYGRMKEGRCLELDPRKADKNDPHYFGCSADVLEFMDVRCSGKPECNVPLNDQELLRQNSSCYKDLMKYLESRYTCVSGKYVLNVLWWKLIFISLAKLNSMTMTSLTVVVCWLEVYYVKLAVERLWCIYVWLRV